MPVEWFSMCRNSVAGIATIMRETAGADRREETGTRGEGGDDTLVLDARAEEVVFGLLDRVHESGVRFTAISEERGRVDFGSDETLVIIDPLDGSTNAKRGLPLHALSVAVADGPTMADVRFGYVYDFGTGEEWTAERGRGAALRMKSLPRDVPEHRTKDGKLELVGVESADPRTVREALEELGAVADRIRALGAIAITLSHVAGGRLDGMLTLRRTRAVDCAAGQLIVRESGGVVCFPGFDDPLGAPLDIEPHAPVVAARTPAALDDLLRVASRV